MANKEIHRLAKEIDEGYELKLKLKYLDEIKLKLREAAEKENPNMLSSGESITLNGFKHKAKINFSEDSFDLKDGLSTIDMRRIKAMVGQGIVEAEEGVKLKEGVSLRKVKGFLGDKYNELFEDDIKFKIKAKEMNQWMKNKVKIASNDDSVSFVEDKLKRKKNTLKVTFGK